jgi:hypothetical protein
LTPWRRVAHCVTIEAIGTMPIEVEVPGFILDVFSAPLTVN